MEWISVKDNLPKKDEDVLIYIEWTGISGTVYKEFFIGSVDEVTRLGCTPLYWMPLPEPPKGEEE